MSTVVDTEPSAVYAKVDSKYSIDGSVTAENVQFLRESHNSALYLCSDSTNKIIVNDKCAPEGFDSLLKSFGKEQALFCPLIPSMPEYQATCGSIPELAVLAYKRFEEALDHLAPPTVIICRSATRASAVLALYKGVKENLTKEEVFAYAEERKFKFLGAEGLCAWIRTVLDQLTRKHKLIFRQLFEKESSTYTYLLADGVTKDAILIDPVLETVERDEALVKELGLKLKCVVNTHCHADHITGTGRLKAISDFTGCESAISATSGAVADVKLEHEQKIYFGSRHVVAVATPGHTEGCMSFILDDLSGVFTGDALLIRGCGRTDFQGGSAATLYASVQGQLFNKLPDQCVVYPAHDYKGRMVSTIGEEKRLNPRLTKSESEFIQIMNNLNLPYPKKFDQSVPANLVCGVF